MCDWGTFQIIRKFSEKDSGTGRSFCWQIRDRVPHHCHQLWSGTTALAMKHMFTLQKCFPLNCPSGYC